MLSVSETSRGLFYDIGSFNHHYFIIISLRMKIASFEILR